MWQTLEFLSVFTTLSLKLIFWKTETFSKNWSTAFLVQSTKIEIAIFSHKTVLPEANVETNRTRSTEWTYYKGRCFASNYFIFLKVFFSLGTFSKELIRCTNYPNAHSHTFRKRWRFIWRCFFPVSILKVLLKY